MAHSIAVSHVRTSSLWMQVAAAICGLWAVVARDLGIVLLPVTLEVVNNVVSMYRTHLEPASLDCLAEVSQPRRS
jgi:hypothetical protein